MTVKTNKLKTFFAPAERATDAEIERQFRQITNIPLLSLLLNSVPSGMLILNFQRQIVFANRSALNLAGIQSQPPAIGLRPGNALRCVHAGESPAACGTTEFCETCGAVKSILAAQAGKSDVQECRIIREPNGEALDLRVWATPFEAENRQWTIFALMDISDEKRRHALERIFFHDILNTAGGIKGFAELLKDADQEETEKYKDIIFSLSRMIVDEINSQQTLTAAENNELAVNPVKIESLALLGEIADLYKQHDVAGDRNIRIDPAARNIELKTDHALLQRVIGNMIKNALEACRPGETITLGCALLLSNRVEFSVHNPNEMPRESQLQVFQRSFSTKGKGRGLGTYSIKLISERYLGGSVSFSSGPEGTIFRASYPLDI